MEAWDGTEEPTAALLKAAAVEVEERGRALAGAYRELSDRYRGGEATPDEAHLTRDHVLAYLAARLPATVAVMSAVLAEVAERRPDWRPASVLDLGAGPGTAGWAAAAEFPSLERATLIERSTAMIQIGRRLAEQAGPPLLTRAGWRCGSVLSAPLEPADLVIASYVLGELGPVDATGAVARWWEATSGELVIVEPGTPAGHARILRARAGLIGLGATVTAPCPADAACPLADGDDWCHFGRRVARSALHRAIKAGELGFEDEKYSYVVASRQGPAHAAARVLRQPQVRSGHIRLTLCEAPETRDVVISRSRREDYRWARRAGWGDPVPPGTGGP